MVYWYVHNDHEIPSESLDRYIKALRVVLSCLIQVHGISTKGTIIFLQKKNCSQTLKDLSLYVTHFH